MGLYHSFPAIARRKERISHETRSTSWDIPLLQLFKIGHTGFKERLQLITRNIFKNIRAAEPFRMCHLAKDTGV